MSLPWLLLVELGLYASCFVCGIVTAASLTITQGNLGGLCMLYGSISYNASSDWLAPQSSSAASLCYFLSAVSVLTAVVCFSLSFYWLYCCCVEEHLHRERVWMSVTLGVCVLCLFFLLVSGCVLKIGRDTLCDSVTHTVPNITSCVDAQTRTWTSPNNGAQFYTSLHKAELRPKLLNSAERCADEALEGISSSGALTLLRGHRVALRSDLVALSGKVALLSGGGSGHEPAHAGYLGQGMLSAAVAGGVFASPPPGSVLAAILSLHQTGAAGVLLLVKNYTGDRLNFGLAAEQARNRGVAVAMVIVADDCAFDRPGKTGRRGLCGTVLVHKLAGALAEEGSSLADIVSKVTEAMKGIGTLGVSLSPCSVPGCLPSFILQPGDMELGLGIHGEPGIMRSKASSADDVVKTMIDHMTNPDSQSHLPLKMGDSVVLCVNNLGSLSVLEMAVVTRAAVRCLEGRGVCVARVMSGSFMTSLEMAGVSLSLMKTSEEILRLFDAPTSAPAWPNLSSVCVSGRSNTLDPPDTGIRPQEMTHSEGPLSSVLSAAVQQACSSLLQLQGELDHLDRASGDGDCGNTHAQAAKAIQEWLQGHVVPGCPGQLLDILAGLVQERMGGSSGAVYSLFLTAAAPHLKGSSDPASWAHAMHAGTEAMRRYGGADPGDRTMLDALCPAAEELRRLTTAPPAGHLDILQAAVEKAESGAESTRHMTARAGRASYIAAECLTLPDPGAVATAAILRAVLESLRSQK